jgi:hypothetical protein
MVTPLLVINLVIVSCSPILYIVVPIHQWLQPMITFGLYAPLRRGHLTVTSSSIFFSPLLWWSPKMLTSNTSVFAWSPLTFFLSFIRHHLLSTDRSPSSDRYPLPFAIPPYHINLISLTKMAHKSPRYCLYRDFVDAYMKAHTEMTRCVRIKKYLCLI